MIVLGWIIVLLTGLLLTGTIYLYLLAAVGFLFRQQSRIVSRRLRFLILVPAHNESTGIIPTLESLTRMETDHDYRTVVIADNCTDDTAEVSRQVSARQTGVSILERNDPERRGKGHALQWAVERIDLGEYDAVAVVDADTVVAPSLLDAMAGSLEHGADAVQVTYQFMPSGESSMAQLQYLASLVENHLFHKPRALLGLPGLLRGSGMAVRSDVLAQHPWDSHSITEDVDFAIKLLRAGHRVEFTATSGVFSAATTDHDQARTQKSRWASGSFAVIVDHFLPLIRAGLNGRPVLIELAFSLLLLSRPLLIYTAGMLALLGIVVSGSFGWTLVGVSALIMAMLIVYLLLGILLAADRKRALSAVAHVPAYGLWFLTVQLKSLFGRRRTDWQRTDRRNDG